MTFKLNISLILKKILFNMTLPLKFDIRVNNIKIRKNRYVYKL